MPMAESTPPAPVSRPAWLKNFSTATGAAPLPGPEVVAPKPHLHVPPPPPGPKPQGGAPLPVQEVAPLRPYMMVPPPPPGPKPQLAVTQFGPPAAMPMGPSNMMSQQLFHQGAMIGVPPQPFPPPQPPAPRTSAGPTAAPASIVVMTPVLGPQPRVERQQVVVTPQGPIPIDSYMPKAEAQPDGSIRIPSKLELAQREWPGCGIEYADTYYALREHLPPRGQSGYI